MEYTSGSSSLSMSGGDDFTGIQEVLDRAVLLDTTQTISSDKTFGVGFTQTYDGSVVLNENTTNEASGVFTNLGNFNNLATIANEGTFTNLVTGTITNDGTLNISGTLNLTTDIVADMTTLNISNTGSTNINPQNIMALQVAGTDKMNVSSTATTLTNATINLQDNTPTTRFTQNNGTTTITNTNIGTNGILTQTGQCLINGAFTTESSAVTLKDNSATTHFLQSASATTINNATINLQDNTPTTRFTQNNGATTITNTNIGLTGITTLTGSSTIKGTTITLQDATPTTRFLQNNGTTTITNTDIATNGILTQTGNFTAKGTTITLQDATPTTRFTQTNGATTITNTAIALTGTTGAMALTTTTGKASINSTTGQIELKTASTTASGILINTTGTGSSIKIHGSGTSNTITLETAGSGGQITIDANSGDILIDGALITFSVPPSIRNSSSPFADIKMCGIQIYCVQQSFNYGTTSTAMSFLSRPDNNSINSTPRCAFPFAVTIYGWTICIDDDGYTGTIRIDLDRYLLSTYTTTSSDNENITTSSFNSAERTKAGTFTTPFLLSTSFGLGVSTRYSTATNNPEFNLILHAYQSPQ